MPPTDVSTLAPPAARDRRVRRRSEVVASLRLTEAAATPRDVAIAAEVPVALVYNDVSHVVMMATPEDLSDFALGFSLSEGILRDRRELFDLEIEEGSTGIAINMTIERGRFAMLENRRRSLTGRTGCGLCGVDDLTQVARPLPRVGSGVPVTSAAIHRALDLLPALQLANRETGAVHAAAWASPDEGEDRSRRRLRRHHQPVQLRDGTKGGDAAHASPGGDLRADDDGAAHCRADRPHIGGAGARRQHHRLRQSRADRRASPMTPSHMLRLANQIALYFASYPREEAIAGIADHIEKFWERRMRQQIVAYVADGGQGLHELALAAAQRLRPVPAARTARA
jgi:hypothetical protein